MLAPFYISFVFFVLFSLFFFSVCIFLVKGLSFTLVILLDVIFLAHNYVIDCF